MPTESKIPNAIISSTNYTGSIADIQDDPDSPDSNWLVVTSVTHDSSVRVSFPTPSGRLQGGAALQTFKVYVAQSIPSNSGIPACYIALWYDGVLIRAGTPVNITGGGQLVSFTWDASELPSLTGADVECRVVIQRAGGSISVRNSVDVGAIEWNVVYLETQTITSPEFIDADALPNPTLTVGQVDLVPTTVLNIATFPATTVVPAGVAVLPSGLLESTAVVNTPSLQQILRPAHTASNAIVLVPTLLKDVQFLIAPTLDSAMSLSSPKIQTDIVSDFNRVLDYALLEFTLDISL